MTQPNPQQSSSQPQLNMKPGAVWFRNNPRLGGFGMMAFCWGLAYWGVLQILASADAGQPHIAISAGYAAFASIGCFGLTCFIGGTPAVIKMQTFGQWKKNWKYYLFVAGYLTPGLLVFAWVKYQLSLRGYN